MTKYYDKKIPIEINVVYGSRQSGKTYYELMKLKEENNRLNVYYDGKCYYYSAQIKHFEDGKDNAAGVMEYAIMRNNIYSLAVTNVKGIGSATLELTPNAPVVDVSAYVNLEVSILPWIVRFNDLDL